MNTDAQQSTATEEEDVTLTRKKRPRIVEVLSLPNFRLLWFGRGISLLGDQFFLMALPWLVLELTGNAKAMGMVLAVAVIPRAAFMLVGGALTDRMSPLFIMTTTSLLLLILVGAMAGLVMASAVTLWMLYLFAFSFGIIDAFFFPAAFSMVPRIVKKDDLTAANALMQGTAQASLLVGPVLAGLLIAGLSGQGPVSDETVEAVSDMRGIGVAFGIDAATFLIAAVFFFLIRLPKEETEKPDEAKDETVLESIRVGLATAWGDPTLRALFFIIAAVHLLFIGPMFVGIPVIAHTRLPDGAFGFGLLISSFGLGMLLGMALAATLPRPSPRRLGSTIMLVMSPQGLGMILLAFATSTPVAAAIAVAVGTASGYVTVLFTTWLQRRTPIEMLGRMMSLIMLASMGLTPIAFAVGGVIIEELSLAALFVGSGILMSLVALIASQYPAIKNMGIETS